MALNLFPEDSFPQSQGIRLRASPESKSINSLLSYRIASFNIYVLRCICLEKKKNFWAKNNEFEDSSILKKFEKVKNALIH
jgi:hypothetical protein